MPLQTNTFTRYLPLDAQSRNWGWNLVDAGRQHIPAGAPYPGKGHPLGYHFEANGRRVLDEFQILFINAGSGIFESASLPETEMQSGDAVILFPGEWHRYGPNPAQGWDEYWIGFKGGDAARVMQAFFKPGAPIHRSIHTDELLRLFDQALHWIAHPTQGGEQILASFIPMILAFLRAEGHGSQTSESDESQLVLHAKLHLLENLSSRPDLEAVAASLGTSYSRFRNVFKKHTGLAPREFVNRAKLNRSRDLLLSGQFNVSRTAEELGYSSVYYYSRAFRQAFGLSPQNWLAKRRQTISE